MKYRLIKEYPGSPKLGTEVNYSETRKNYFYFRGILYTELPKNQVEDLPEYWEKVVKKDYEILSFSHSNGLTTLRDNGRYLYEKVFSDCYNGRGATLNEILNNGEYCDYKIHSVRRLSDGEIFTVGDVLELKGVCKKGKITEFKILKGKSDTGHSARINRLLEKVDDKIGVAVDNYHIPTELLSELTNKLLFTTEDGVEIYPNVSHTLWFITKDKSSLNPFLIREVRIFNKNHIYPNDWIFYHKKNAEKWVKDNEPKNPLFKTEDRVNIYEGDKYHSVLFNSFDYKGEFVAQSLDKGNNWTNPYSCKMFSTKEAAEEYILMNKPCLSINDVQNKMFNIIGEPYYSNITIKLKELVKQKITKNE